MIHKKNCPYCGIAFQPSDRRQKFCSTDCAAHGKTSSFAENRTCLVCGKEYIAKAPHQKYCSTLCQSRSRSDYHARKHKKRKKIEIICPYNIELICYQQTCGECGWNPEVAKARLQAYERKWKGEDNA